MSKIINLRKEQNKKKIKIPKLAEILIESVFASLKIFYIKEFQFHPIRQWRADYYLPDLKLLIELEGGVFGFGKKNSIMGGHNRGKGYIQNLEKYNAANEMLYHQLRFANVEVERTKGQNVIDSLKNFIQNKKMAG